MSIQLRKVAAAFMIVELSTERDRDNAGGTH
jgi:hypothetical protein